MFKNDPDNFDISCDERDKKALNQKLTRLSNIMISDLSRYFGSCVVSNNYEMLRHFANSIIETGYEAGYQQSQKENDRRLIAEYQKTQLQCSKPS